MSRIYDNWEKLVEAVLRREKDRQLALWQSFSSSSSADPSSRFSSFSFDPFLRDDVNVDDKLKKHQESQATNGNKYLSFEYESDVDKWWDASSAELDSHASEDEDDSHGSLLRRTTIGNGLPSNSKVVYEGWMVRYGRRKIGRSFIHMRYFVLESRLLAYYKKNPKYNVVPTKTLLIDGNCRVEDQGLKTYQGHMIYVLSVYNKKEKYNQITMAAFNIQEALIWKEKIESVIDQHQESQATNGNKYLSFEYKSDVDNGRNASSSEHDSQFSAAEDEDDSHRSLLRRTTIGNGPPESVYDWTKEFDSDLANQNSNNQAFSRKYWRLLQCQNGLRIFEELDEVDILPKSCSRAMKAVGVVEATCEEIFELIMGMDTTRCEWDCSFQYGSLVEEVDGHTAILYHRLQLDWFPLFVWPRDLCYVRYWRRNDDGSYVVLFRSREHENCIPQPGFVRAHIECGGYNISPLKPRNGRTRTQVQHLMQIDLKGWGVGYASSFQQHCLLQMLNSVAGLRDYYSQT